MTRGTRIFNLRFIKDLLKTLKCPPLKERYRLTVLQRLLLCVTTLPINLLKLEWIDTELFWIFYP